MIANLGYTLTFGQHDPQILRRSLDIDVAVVALLQISAKLHLAGRARHPGANAGPLQARP